MIDEKQLADLNHPLWFKNLTGARYMEMVHTIEDLWKIARAAQKLVVHCNHKPDGWDELDKALRALDGQMGGGEEAMKKYLVVLILLGCAVWLWAGSTVAILDWWGDF